MSDSDSHTDCQQQQSIYRFFLESGYLFLFLLPTVIISDPLAFAHIHCVEAMGIPLLLNFSECYHKFYSSRDVCALVHTYYIPKSRLAHLQESDHTVSTSSREHPGVRIGFMVLFKLRVLHSSLALEKKRLQLILAFDRRQTRH